MRLDAVVRNLHKISWGKARDWIETGKVSVRGEVITDCAYELQSEEGVELRMNAPRPRSAGVSRADGLERSRLVFVDTQIVVVNKPAGMSTVPFEKGEKDTLDQLVALHLKQPRVVVVHRLDRETSGLLVFARGPEAGKALANQFRFHTVRRRYLALVQGHARSTTIRSEILDDRGDGLRGSVGSRGSHAGFSRNESRLAVTHVELLSHDAARGVSLVECRLETGRTHQIRIHLSEAGTPLLGEKAYIREFGPARVEAPRLMLHAIELGVNHPTRDVPMRWVEPPPLDFMRLAPAGAEKLIRSRFLDER